jgi:hypothetical protein
MSWNGFKVDLGGDCTSEIGIFRGNLSVNPLTKTLASFKLHLMVAYSIPFCPVTHDNAQQLPAQPRRERDHPQCHHQGCPWMGQPFIFGGSVKPLI